MDFHEKAFENVVCEMVAILSRPQCVKQQMCIYISVHDKINTYTILCMSINHFKHAEISIIWGQAPQPPLNHY